MWCVPYLSVNFLEEQHRQTVSRTEPSNNQFQFPPEVSYMLCPSIYSRYDMSISSDTEAGRIVKSAVGEAHENCFLRMYDGIGRKCESRFWLRQETTSTSTFKGARSKSRLRWLILQIGFTPELYGRAAHDKVRVSEHRQTQHRAAHCCTRRFQGETRKRSSFLHS